MHIYTPVIDPAIYQKTSLAETLHDLNNPKLIVTDDIVINLVLKYFFAYLYPETITQRVDFKVIEQFFERGEKYCAASRNDGDKKVLHNITPIERDFYARFEAASYGLSMLGDVAPSASIVKDIITRKIDPTPFEGTYVGLDLGTGTGILLLAQCIQAMRNDFKSIQNIGIELDQSTALRTKDIASRLHIGNVLQGDTTQESLYHTLNITTPITFISNENIPTTGIPMNGKNDPFHQNNQTIYQSDFAKKLHENTQTFPKAIAMTLSIPPAIHQQMIGGYTNKFFIDNISNFENLLKAEESFTYEKDWTIFHNIYTDGIALDGKIVPMHSIGDELIASGKVKKIPQRRHRRSDKMIKQDTL